MSGRSAVINTLLADAGLNGFGLDGDTIIQARGLDERPTDTGPFVLLRWAADPGPVFGRVRAPRRLQVWVHYPQQVTNDFTKIDNILDRIEEVLVSMEHVSGDDGYTVTCVDVKGRSDDLKDEGLQTYCRWGSFEVLSRKESV